MENYWGAWVWVLAARNKWTSSKWWSPVTSTTTYIYVNFIQFVFQIRKFHSETVLRVYGCKPDLQLLCDGFHSIPSLYWFPPNFLLNHGYYSRVSLNLWLLVLTFVLSLKWYAKAWVPVSMLIYPWRHYISCTALPEGLWLPKTGK